MNTNPPPTSLKGTLLLLRPRPKSRATIIGLASVTLAAISCGRLSSPAPDAPDLSPLSAQLEVLSHDIGPILASGSVTTMPQLRLEYSRLYPRRPPLFSASTPAQPERSAAAQYALPVREYFWLTSWSTNDSPATPLFWSRFHLPREVVEYLALDGKERCCPSNDFWPLLAELSNRVERANVDETRP
jgi:hypothetical protein